MKKMPRHPPKKAEGKWYWGWDLVCPEGVKAKDFDALAYARDGFRFFVDKYGVKPEAHWLTKVSKGVWRLCLWHPQLKILQLRGLAGYADREKEIKKQRHQSTH